MIFYLSPIFGDKMDALPYWNRKDERWMRLNSQSILNILSRSLEGKTIEESMRVNCKERLEKNQFDLTVRKDERFLLSLSLLLSIHETVNTLEESIRLNCQERRKIPSISPLFFWLKSLSLPYFEGSKSIFTLFFGIKSMLYPDFTLFLDCKHWKNSHSPIYPLFWGRKSRSFGWEVIQLSILNSLFYLSFPSLISGSR